MVSLIYTMIPRMETLPINTITQSSLCTYNGSSHICLKCWENLNLQKCMRQPAIVTSSSQKKIPPQMSAFTHTRNTSDATP